MTNRVKNTSITLTAAIALASGAYALGSQAGDGSAIAAISGDTTSNSTTTPIAAGPAGRPFGANHHQERIDDLAQKLGVEPSKLRAALDDLRPRNARERHAPPEELVKALADGLNKPSAEVKAALEKLRPSRDGRRAERLGRRAERFDGFAAALAKPLGKRSAEVSAALKKVAADKPAGRHGDPGAFVDALAKELGVTEAKLRTALRKARPAHGPGRHGGPGGHGPAAADLAKELGVETAAVQKVLDSFRDGMAARMKAKHDEFIAALADKLGIPEAKVRDALPEGPRGGPRFGRHP